MQSGLPAPEAKATPSPTPVTSAKLTTPLTSDPSRLCRSLRTLRRRQIHPIAACHPIQPKLRARSKLAHTAPKVAREVLSRPFSER